MNILAFLTVLFGTAAILLLYALLAARDEAAGWRIYARTITESGMEIVTHCDDLEARNDWLESRRDHCKGVLAASMAQARIPRRDKTRMVAEKMEYLSDYPR